VIRLEALELRHLADVALQHLNVADTAQVLEVRELTDGTWMVAFEDRSPRTRFPSFEIGVQKDWSPERASQKLRVELRNKLWICPLCQRRAQIRRIIDQDVVRVECDRCGRFEIEQGLLESLRASHDAGDQDVQAQLVRLSDWVNRSTDLPVLKLDNWRLPPEPASS
jgi:hypothetical protein